MYLFADMDVHLESTTGMLDRLFEIYKHIVKEINRHK